MANEFLNRSVGGPTSGKTKVSPDNIQNGFQEPSAKARPQVDINIQLPSTNEIIPVGNYFKNMDFKGMINGGYIIRATIYDAHFNIHSKLSENGFFDNARKSPVRIDFSLKHGPDSDIEASDYKFKTKMQTAILISYEVTSREGDGGHVEMVAIDPPSYFLSAGTASGKAYTGKVSDVIAQVVAQYTSESIQLRIPMTTDSRYTKWYMMRQDPKTFIKSLLDWSASLNPTKTNWIIGSDGFKMHIMDQGSLTPEPKGLYRYASGNSPHTIRGMQIISDHSLSILQTKLITHGVSTISGKYWDGIVDMNSKAKYVSVMDSTTQNKKVAEITQKWQSFQGPNEDSKPPYSGFTSIGSVPEIDSSGGIGLNYEEYIDGRARKLWLETSLGILNARFTVLGHGIYSNTMGLGIDTIFIHWTKGDTVEFDLGDSPRDIYWVTGNWLLYGFHHRISRKEWLTDLYCSRYDRPRKPLK